MKTVPILLNHDQTKPIGFAQFCERGILVTLAEPMPKKQIFAIFGNCGCIVESYRNAMIEKFILTHWSHDATTATST